VVSVGQVVPITGSYTIEGGSGSGGVGCSYAMGWQHSSPGASFSFDSEDPAAPLTDYTKNWTATLPLGTHTIEVYVTHTDPNVPAVFVTPSNTLTFTVQASHRSVDTTVPARTMTAGLPSRSLDAELPSRNLTAGAPDQ
jgi:hypothetical protein